MGKAPFSPVPSIWNMGWAHLSEKPCLITSITSFYVMPALMDDQTASITLSAISAFSFNIRNSILSFRIRNAPIVDAQNWHWVFGATSYTKAAKSVRIVSSKAMFAFGLVPSSLISSISTT